MADYITLGFNIFCIVLIFFGLFWGLIRGLKKTVSRFIFLLVLGIILIFVTIPLTNLILKIPVDMTTIDSKTGGEIVEKVPLINLLSSFMNNIVGRGFAIKNPEFMQTIASLPLTLVYVIVFVVLFWTLKLLLLPFNAVINKLIFGKKKKPSEQFGFSASEDETPNENANQTTDEVVINMASFQEEKSKKELRKARKQEKKENRIKKHRLLGGLVGCFVGVMLIFYTMVPFYGIINIADSIKATKINNLTNTPTTLDEMSQGIIGDVVKGYDLSALGRISEVLAIENLGVKTFDHLTTAKVNDTEISLREDVNTLVSTVVKVDTLIGNIKNCSDNGLENITPEELTTLIGSVDDIVTTCSEIKFVNAMSEYIIPIAHGVLTTNDIQLVDDPHINQLIIEMLDSLIEESGINVFAELKGIVEIAKYTNDQGLLHPIITGKTDNILGVFDGLDRDFSTQLSNKIFAIKTVDTVFPQILNIGLKFFDNATDFGYVENNATKEELKLSMTQLISSIVSTAQSLSSESSIYLTDSSLIELGKVLNTFRNSKLFNIDTYNNLVDYAMNQIKTMTVDVVPENFTDTFNNKLLRNVSEVENWELEMGIIYNTLQILRNNENGILGDVVEGEDLRVGYTSYFSLNEGTLTNLGIALDNLEKSVLLGNDCKITLNSTDYTNTTLISVVSSLFTELYSSIESEDAESADLLSIINNMKDNLILSSHTYDNTSTYWKDEFSAIAPLLCQIEEIASSEEFELTTELGENLDRVAHDSIMLGNDTTLILMEKLMAKVQDSILGENFAPVGDDRLDDKIYNLLVAIRNNLLSDDMKDALQSDDNFWTTEMECIIALNNIADKSDTISSISSAMELSSDLDKVYTSRLIPTAELNATLAKVLRQLKSTETTGINGKINELIEDIATDISSSTFFDDKEKTDFWTIELGHINTLTNIEFEDSADYKVVENLSTIGANIDDIVFGDGTTRSSYLITENRIRDILSFVVSDMSSSIADGFEAGELKTTITTTLDEISTNLYNPLETTQVQITSFERELGHLSSLADLDIDSTIFTYTNDATQLQALENRLESIGSKLDSIAYNNQVNENITSYNEELNSNIITRTMIANIISSAFSTAKVSVELGDELTNTELAFNTLIDDIKASINSINTDDKVITWQRELSYVSTLIQLNSGEEFTLENAATDIGANIDKIAFNHKNNAFLDVEYNSSKNIVGPYVAKTVDDSDPDNIITTHYNSVIITRNILKTAVNSMIADFKVENPNSQEEIANELIDNLSTRVAVDTYSSSIYNDYENALTDLNSVKTTMETTADDMSTVTIDTLSDENITTIDNMLDGFETKIICGTTTTRKIAVMLIKDFKTESPETTEEELTNEIIQNLIDKINAGEIADYATAFTELKDIEKNISDIKSLFDAKNIRDFSQDEFVSVDQMLTNFQSKTICGVLTTRKIAKLMVDKSKDSLTNNGTNTAIMSTSVGVLITNLQTHYQTGITNASQTPETYYSTTTAEYYNPMASIYNELNSLV